MDLITSCNKFITKFEIEDNTYYIKFLWKRDENDLFQVKVFDGENSWSGRFSNDFAQEFRRYLHKNLEEYCTDVIRCLAEQNKDYKYEFLIVPGETNSATFKCSKSFDDALVTYVSVPLKRDYVTESKDAILDFLILENRNLKHTVEEYNQKTKQMQCDLEKCKLEMEKFITLKTSLESTLYAKFVQLLNKKKERILLLETLNNS